MRHILADVGILEGSENPLAACVAMQKLECIFLHCHIESSTLEDKKTTSVEHCFSLAINSSLILSCP